MNGSLGGCDGLRYPSREAAAKMPAGWRSGRVEIAVYMPAAVIHRKYTPPVSAQKAATRYAAFQGSAGLSFAKVESGVRWPRRMRSQHKAHERAETAKMAWLTGAPMG